MKKSDLEGIKDIYRIIEHEKYIVLVGKKLWIFDDNYCLIACRSDLSNSYKVAFLPDNTMLIDGGKNAYHLISLSDGREIWNIPQSKKEFGSNRFTLSTKSDFAYDYYVFKGNLYFVTINLLLGTIDSYQIEKELRSTVDIMCDDDGVPCLLQEHFSNIAGISKSENGILYQHQDEINKGSSYYWKAKWQFDGTRISLCFLYDVNTVLTNDLWVYDAECGSMYNLLENETTLPPMVELPIWCKFDRSKQYLIIMYKKFNLVVDIQKRKIVARYAVNYSEGCLIGDTFWFNSQAGIIRKPFPLIEEIPPDKLSYWSTNP